MKSIIHLTRMLAGVLVVGIAVTVVSFDNDYKNVQRGSVLGLSQASITKTTDTEFNQGSMVSVAVSGTGSAAAIQLAGTAGPDGTQYKRSITLTNSSGGTLTDYQFMFILDTSALITAGKMQANCPDIRFRDSDDVTSITNYWVENCGVSGSASSKIWVKVPSTPIGGKTIYLYYGKNSIATQSSTANTFIDDIAGVVGAWSFNEASGSTASDTSGNNLTGTASGTTITTGKFGNARSYSLASGEVVLFTNTNLGANWTVNARVNFPIPYSGNWRTLFARNGGNYHPILVQAGSNLLGYYNGGWFSCGYDVSTASSGWHLLTAVGTGGSTKFYLDGTNICTAAGQITNQEVGAIGNYQIGGGQGPGTIVDEPRIYNQPLSQSSITNLANNYGYSTTNYPGRELVRKYAYVSGQSTGAEGVSTSVGNESVALSPSGTWESPTNSNVIDLVWNGGWGDGTDGSTAFTATVANVSVNATVNFQMKVAASIPALSSASYIDLGTASGGTTFTKTRAEFAGLGIDTGTSRYVQVKATLAQTNGVNPQLDSFTLNYQADQDPPTNPTTLTSKNESGGSVTLTTNTWYNYPTPYFSWSGGADADSGIAGYYVYFGTNAAANPSDPGLGLTPQAGTTYTASSLVSGLTYYLRIKTIDVAGNLLPTIWSPFIYKYESTQPTNPSSISVTPVGYTSVNSFLFNWNVGSDEGNGSGLWGYCFKTGTTDDQSPYYTDQCQTSRSINNVPAYQSGENIFYVRSKDNAGNLNDQYLPIVYYWNANAPSAPRNVVVTQAASLVGTSCTSLDNCFSVTWDLPETYLGSIVSYYYAVNTDPMTLLNSTQTSESETASRSLTARPLATKQGTNTLYTVAKDNSGNVNFDEVAQGTGIFLASTTAPGAPTNLQITDSSNRDTQKYQLTLTWDTPEFTGSGIDHYNIYRSLNNITFTQIATATGGSTGYLDTGLSNATTYYYKITAEDNALAESAPSSVISGVPTGRFTTPPEILVQPTVSPSILSAMVSWKMARTCQGYVQIRQSSSDDYTEQGAGNSTADQTVTVVGLTPNTIYLYRIRCQDIDGNNAYSSESSFKTNDAPSAPTNLIANPSQNSQNLFTFSWNAPSDLGVTIAYYYFSVNQKPNAINITRVDTNQLSTGPYATQQGVNTLYVLAVDTAGNYNLANYASVDFIAQTVAPGIPTNVTITDSSNRASSRYSLTVEWDLSVGSPDYYEVYRSVDSITFVKVSEVRSTIYSETKLDTNLIYYYYVIAVDNAGARSVKSTTVSKQPTGKYVTPPEYTSEPEVSVTSTTATIKWTTNRVASSFVLFGKTSELGQSTGSLTDTLIHEVTLIGLDASTTYSYKLQSFDEARDYSLEKSQSKEYELTTLVAPAISDVKVDEIRQTSALLVWKTTTVSTSIVKYGKTTDYGLQINDESTGGTTVHTVKMAELESESLYHVRIYGTDINGNELQSDDYVFQTLAFPRIFNVLYEPVRDASSATIKVAWETNVETDSIIEYRIVGGSGVFAEKVTSELTKEHELIVPDLADNAVFEFRAKGRDQYGNIALSEVQEYATPFDTRPPKISDVVIETAISGAGSESKAQIIVSWQTDEVASSQVEYGEGVGGSTYGSSTVEDGLKTNSHMVIISDVASSKPYHLRVVSRDSAGNASYSDDYVVITGRATQSVLDLVVVNLQQTFGWLGNIFNFLR